MKFATITALCLSVSVSARVPLVRRQSPAAAPTDTDVLNFALTLEHLENAFYSGALAKFNEDDFVKAGLPTWARGRFSQVAAHEAEHVKFLETALGSAATKPCNYSFGYTDPKSFADLSAALETVGTSAYTGASTFISNKDFLLAAATVLATEARHAGWVESSVRKGAPWGTAFETPLDLNQVFTLASAFITSCPSTNPTLPVKAFPALSVKGTVAANQKITLSYKASGNSTSGPLFAVFLSGQNAVVVPLSNGTSPQVQIPSDLRGYAYLSVSTDKTGLNSNQTVAGPTILDLSFNSNNDAAQVAF